MTQKPTETDPSGLTFTKRALDELERCWFEEHGIFLRNRLKTARKVIKRAEKRLQAGFIYELKVQETSIQKPSDVYLTPDGWVFYVAEDRIVISVARKVDTPKKRG